MRVAVVAVVLIASGCEGGGSDACPAGVLMAGQSCAVSSTARCFTGDDCFMSQVCRCQVGTWSCTDVDYDAPCGDIQNASCTTEGLPDCSAPPPSEYRSCVDGQWQATSSCPDGCPEGSEPDVGDPCDLEAGEVCRYGDVHCDCADGMFRCCDFGPC
jgi:hypothetical protein